MFTLYIIGNDALNAAPELMVLGVYGDTLRTL
jgi:hypothetical protein